MSAAPSPGSDNQMLAPMGINEADRTVTLRLKDVMEHARCPICMGILRETRTISVCMHRFCKNCIEAWLRTQVDNNCPQCRESFASRRNCKPDPKFDQLISAIFGGEEGADAADHALQPSLQELEAAIAVGSDIVVKRDEQRKEAQRQHTAGQVAQRGNGRQLGDGVDSGQEGIGNPNGRHVGGDALGAKRPASAALVRTDSTKKSGDFVPGSKKSRKVKPPSRFATQAPAVHRAGDGANANNYGSNRTHQNNNDYYYINNVNSTERLAASPAVGASALPPPRFVGVRPFCGSWMAYVDDATSSSSSAVMLGQYTSEELAAKVRDFHLVRTFLAQANARGEAIPPETIARAVTLNFPQFASAYQKLTDQGVAEGGTSAEYTAAAGVIDAVAKAAGTTPASTAPVGAVPTPALGAPPGWSQPLATEADRENEAGAARARELAAVYPSRRIVSPGASGNGGTACVVVTPSNGLAENLRWKMRCMMCAGGTSMAQLRHAIAQGLAEQHGNPQHGMVSESDAAKNYNKAPVNGAIAGSIVHAESILLHVVNELDSSADFGTIYIESCFDNGKKGEKASWSGAGALALRDEVRVRDLMLLLADVGEDLILEYAISGA